MRELARRTDVTRLGEGVDATGRLSDEAVARVLDVVSGYREEIDRLGAEGVVAVATSAMRDAENGQQLRDELVERFGIDARTISGDEEARLTFLGATAGRPAAMGETLVVDIGGGSTELVVGTPGSAADFHVSTRMGSVRQTERHLHGDPPTAEQVAALSDEVAELLRREVPEDRRREVVAGIAVAGTATSLAAIDQELDPYDPERVHGYTLSAGASGRMLSMLAELPVERRREVTGLHPGRAPTIVAGVAILVESMRAFGLKSVEVSERDILHGAALAAGEEGVRAPG